jgi:hypothetical protein
MPFLNFSENEVATSVISGKWKNLDVRFFFFFAAPNIGVSG